MTAALVKRPNPARAVRWVLAAMLSVIGSVAWGQVTVSLTAPANGSNYVPPVNLALSATASAGSGYTISKVEFFNGTTLVGTDTTSPYSIVWNNVPSGQHVLTAKATAVKKNSPNQTATSTAVNITVNSPPLANMTSPVDGSAYPIPPPPVAVNVTASDSDGNIARVDFYDCSSLQVLATRTAPPYSFTWTLPTPYWDVEFGKFRMYAIGADVYDNLGGWTPTGCKSVFVRPTIALTAPANGATFSAPATIALSATVAPSDAPIAKMRFYRGTTLLGEDLSPPYSFTWQNVPVGNYPLTAKAVDNYDLEYASTPVNVIVTAASASAQLHFIHVDHLNTPRLVANQSGQTVWRWDQQEPFGNNPTDENPSGLGTFDLPLRLPGQYLDKETNLHYNYFRDYDPGVGRYLQSDLIGLAGGINTYAYVSSNVLLDRDVLGLSSHGCGAGPAYRGIPNLWFRECCDAHDACYEDCRRLPTKLECDSAFCDCVFSKCAGWANSAACRALAGSYCVAGTQSEQSQRSFDESRQRCRQTPLACIAPGQS